jgi:hypothetical protein
MQLGDVNQVVEVAAQTPLLQTENAALGQVVESRKVLEMPLNGRSVFGLVALVPGVVPEANLAPRPPARTRSRGATIISAEARRTRAPRTSMAVRSTPRT